MIGLKQVVIEQELVKNLPNSRSHGKFGLEWMSRKVQKLSNRNWKWIDGDDGNLFEGFDFEPFRDWSRFYAKYDMTHSMGPIPYRSLSKSHRFRKIFLALSYSKV